MMWHDNLLVLLSTTGTGRMYSSVSTPLRTA